MFTKNQKLLIKEIIFSILAILSVGLLFWEIFDSPTKEQQRTIFIFDIFVAIVFLSDFLYQIIHAKNKKHFLIHNWFLVLASIPIVEGWAEVLRGLRLLSLVRLLRAGEHVKYAEELIIKDRKK